MTYIYSQSTPCTETHLSLCIDSLAGPDRDSSLCEKDIPFGINPYNTVWGQFDPGRSFLWVAQIPSASQFWDFMTVRLSIVISFQMIFSNSMHKWHPYNQIYVYMGKDTKIEFLSQILRKLWGIEYLAHLAHTAILFFAYITENLLKGAGVALFWFFFIWYVK